MSMYEITLPCKILGYEWIYHTRDENPPMKQVAMMKESNARLNNFTREPWNLIYQDKQYITRTSTESKETHIFFPIGIVCTVCSRLPVCKTLFFKTKFDPMLASEPSILETPSCWIVRPYFIHCVRDAHLWRHWIPKLILWNGNHVLQLQILDWEVDNRGVFLDEEIVLGEALDVHNHVLGQLREQKLSATHFDVVHHLAD